MKLRLNPPNLPDYPACGIPHATPADADAMHAATHLCPPS